MKSCAICDANGREAVSFFGKLHGTCRLGPGNRPNSPSTSDDGRAGLVAEPVWVPYIYWCRQYAPIIDPPVTGVQVISIRQE